MDIKVAEEAMIAPAEILYLADKLVSRNHCVTLEERFSPRLKRHALDSETRRLVLQRLENALAIKGKIERKLGRSLYELLRENNFM
jgi:hypothetical protein